MAKSDQYEPLIQKYAKEYGVPAELMREQLRSESNFDPRAVSSAGAAGIAQFMPKTGNSYGMKAIKKGNKWYATEDFFDPEKSIKAQAMYMSDIYNKQAGKDWGVTLAMYNMGARRVNERGLKSIFVPGGEYYEKETQGYVQRTLERAGLRSPRIEETLATQQGSDSALYGTPALRALKKRQDDLKKDLGLLSQDYLTEYDQDAEAAYDAQPDLDLMRELAQRAYQQDTDSATAESNLASQLASLMNPAFAKQFQDQTTPRVNAARNYFSNLGMLNRQAMSSSQSKARSRRRSDAQMQSLRGQIKAIEDQMGGLRELEIKGEQSQKKIETTAQQKRKTEKARPLKAPRSKDFGVAQAKKQSDGQLSNVEKALNGTPEDEWLKKVGLGEWTPEVTNPDTTDPTAIAIRKKLRDQQTYWETRTLALEKLEGQERYTDAEYQKAWNDAQKAMGYKPTKAPDEIPGTGQPIPSSQPSPDGQPMPDDPLKRLKEKRKRQNDERRKKAGQR